MTDIAPAVEIHQPFIEWLEIAYGEVRAKDLAQLPAELLRTMFPLIVEYGPAAESILPFYENIMLLLDANNHITYPLTQYLIEIGEGARSINQMTDASVEALQLDKKFWQMSEIPRKGLDYKVKEGIYAVLWVLSSHNVLPAHLAPYTQKKMNEAHRIIIEADNVVTKKGLRKW